MPWKPPISSHQQRDPRRPVLIPVEIYVDGSWREARVLNISSGGLLLRTLDPILPGTEVQLRSGQEVINATIAWRHGTCAGLQFADPSPGLVAISPAEAAGSYTVSRQPAPAPQQPLRARSA